MAAVTRRYWVDLNDMRVSDSLASRSPVQEIRLKRADSSRVGFQFHRNGSPELLPGGTTLCFGGKQLNDFAGDFLFSSTSFTAATTTNISDFLDSDFYYSAINLNTTEITTALGDNDREVAAMCELELDISGAGERASTPIINCVLEADICRGGEGTSSSGNPPWPSDVSELIRFKNDITSGIGGTSADLDNLVTATVTDLPYTVAFLNADNSDTLEFWTLTSGTDAESYPGNLIRPDDWATTTNERVWKRSDLFQAVDEANVSADSSRTNYSPGAATLESNLSAIDTALGSVGDVVSDTSPQLGGQLDVNGNAIGDGTRELLTFTEDASAVNHVDIENEATGSGPTISAAGDDTNIDLNLAGKGSGDVQVGGSAVLTAADVTRAILAGQSGGQTLNGGTAASNTLTLQSTSNATKGGVVIGDDDWLEFDEISEPSSPAAGSWRQYATSAGFYLKSDTGTTYDLTSGTAARYKTIILPIRSFAASTGTPADSTVQVTAGGRDAPAWLFDDSSNEYINTIWRIPTDCDVSADVKFRLQWTTPTASSGNVEWDVISYGNIGDEAQYNTAALETSAIIDSTIATRRCYIPAPVTILSGGTGTAGNVMEIFIGRDTSTASNMTGDAALVGCEIQYKVSDDTSGW